MGLLDTSRGGEGSSHLDDLEALEQVAALHPHPATFETWLRGRLEAPGGGPAGGVTLSTIHRVKGMEWDRVAVFGVNAGMMPHRLAVDEEEERRILHVAITRCRREVVLLTDEARPSPFLAELRGERAHLAFTPPGPGVALDAARTPVGPVARSASRGGPGDGERLDVDPALEQALRAWRAGRSQKDRVPAFIVLHDRTLRAVAAARPTSLIALRGVPGIGPTKLELYGEEILAAVASVAAGPTPPALPSSGPTGRSASRR